MANASDGHVCQRAVAALELRLQVQVWFSTRLYLLFREKFEAA